MCGPVSFKVCPLCNGQGLCLKGPWEVRLQGVATGKVRKMSGRQCSYGAMGVDMKKGITVEMKNKLSSFPLLGSVSS